MRIDSYLRQSPIFQAGRAARRMDASLSLLLAGEQLSVFEALLLAAIFLEKSGDKKRGGIKPSELAEAFQTTRGNVSHCISSLEAKGLVERRIDPDDARAFQLLLKPLGQRRAVRIVGILDQTQRRIEDAVGTAKLESMVQQMSAVAELCERLTAAK
jgi:DNA-binding MarR family transcriptional regulator